MRRERRVGIFCHAIDIYLGLTFQKITKFLLRGNTIIYNGSVSDFQRAQCPYIIVHTPIQKVTSRSASGTFTEETEKVEKVDEIRAVKI